MVPCTTGLKGKYKVGFHDAGEREEQFLEVQCRVHAIAYRGVEVDGTGDNIPHRRGTWYLITLEQLEWKRNPMWIHEGDSHLNLGY